MGEARRRKEAGLPPKITKQKESSNSLNLLAKYPRLGIYLGALFVLYLIYDVVNYYSK